MNLTENITIVYFPKLSQHFSFIFEPCLFGLNLLYMMMMITCKIKFLVNFSDKSTFTQHFRRRLLLTTTNTLTESTGNIFLSYYKSGNLFDDPYLKNSTLNREQRRLNQIYFIFRKIVNHKSRHFRVW